MKRFNNRPMVSVIVPIYNKQTYLDECIVSILSQSYCNLEIILINDGSTDLSGKICDHWKGKDARIAVRHIKNGGVGNARNLGISCANGECIMFVDADDVLEKVYIEKMIDTYQAYGVKLVTCALRIVYNSKDKNESNGSKAIVLLKEGFYQIRDYIMQLVRYDVHYYFNGPYAKLICSDLIKGDGGIWFEKDDNLGEDFVFNMKLLQRTREIYVIEKALYGYRIDAANSLSKSRHLTDYYFKRYCIMYNAFIELLTFHKCDKECQEDIKRFQNKIVKLVSRNVVFDQQYPANREKRIRLSQLRDYYNKQNFLVVQRNASMEIKISVFCLKYRLYYTFIVIMRLNQLIRKVTMARRRDWV